jgi:hypothetical protein
MFVTPSPPDCQFGRLSPPSPIAMLSSTHISRRAISGRRGCGIRGGRGRTQEPPIRGLLRSTPRVETAAAALEGVPGVVLPGRAAPIGHAVRWIAQLGGVLGRGGDGEPGPTVVWRGLRRLEDLPLGWQIAHARSPAPLVGNG